MLRRSAQIIGRRPQGLEHGLIRWRQSETDLPEWSIATPHQGVWRECIHRAREPLDKPIRVTGSYKRWLPHGC